MATKYGKIWNEYRDVMEMIVRICKQYLYMVCIYIIHIYGNEMYMLCMILCIIWCMKTLQILNDGWTEFWTYMIWEQVPFEQDFYEEKKHTWNSGDVSFPGWMTRWDATYQECEMSPKAKAKWSGGNVQELGYSRLPQFLAMKRQQIVQIKTGTIVWA